jgi:hypothetical protein
VSDSLYRGHRFPPEIISHCIWLYFRFGVSFRDVEEMMASRGVLLSYETVRRWCDKFGQQPDVAHGPSAPCTAPSSEPNAPPNSPITVSYIKPTDTTPPTTPSPVLTFNPQSVIFGTISAGTLKQQTLTIRNAGTAPVTFPTGSIALTQTDTTANVYSISAGTCTGIVQVNKTCNAVVSLNTTTTTAKTTYTGTVKVFTFSVNVTATIK